MGKNFLKSSLLNASFNIIFQVSFRIVTFLLNAFVLRNISQAVLGVMNVRLLLLESTVLFLSREAFRRACLTRSTEHNWPQVINLLWITVPLSFVLCVLFGWIWLYALTTPDLSVTAHYAIGVWAVCISCVLRMFVEPLYLVAQAFLFVKLRVLIETFSLSVRTILFTCLVIWRPGSAVIAFSVAQIVEQICYTVAYVYYFKNYMNQRSKTTVQQDDFPFKSLTDFLPKWLPGEPLVDIQLCTLTWSFLKQGILKQILTEGERYVMTLFAVLSFSEQGIYDVVNNLGSLAARFIFRPIEESAYFYFTQLVHRDKPILQQNEEQMNEAALVLKQLLRCVCSLGIVVIFFGQSYSKLLLLFYGGKPLAESIATTLLRTHCFAVLLLALNGITECFALATMNAVQIDRYNRVMAYLSFGFLVISWILTKLFGSVGFILANCCNMSARIVHSIMFIKKKYEGTKYEPLNGIIPRKYFLCTVILSGVLTLISESLYYEESKVLHLAIGTVLFFLTLAVWAYEESDLIKLGYNKYRRNSLKSQ